MTYVSYRPVVQRNISTSSIRVDIIEEKERYLLYADLPGFSEEDLSIEVKENLLSITVEKHREEEKESRYLIRERNQRRRTRSFVLAKDADSDSVQASLKNGLLNIEVSKLPEKQPRKIAIQG